MSADREAAIRRRTARLTEGDTLYDTNWLLAELAAAREREQKLREALVEHHAVGALDGVVAGDQCPICAALAASGRRG